MQALSERLHDLLAGSRFEGAVAMQFSALKTFQPRPDSLVGSTLERVSRRGKYLVFGFGGERILVHLSQGGRVFLEDGRKQTRPKGGVVRLLFEGRPGILIKEFGSQRKAAWWVLAAGDDGPLDGLGPEPFWEGFADLVVSARDRRRLHTLLRDQRAVAGIGRGYADDILWRARLSPYATLDAVPPERREELVAIARAALTDGLARERTRSGGLPAKLGERFEVHGRYGRPCPRCGADLRRVSYESYEITYCPTCQTDGRTLADRRMSRLVK
jgi:formamidopyrimidine-DNA glycosylase